MGEPGEGGRPARVTLLGVAFDALTEAECVDEVIRRCTSGTGGWVVTPNLHILRSCVYDPGVRELVGRADVVVADGTPLVWASRLQGTPLPERVAGSNLVSSVPRAAARHGLSLFLLGGAPGTAEAAAAILCRGSPGLRVVGTFFPEFGFERDPARIDAMARAVADAAPDIVFVALSFPKGERLIERIRSARPSACWIGVGISFSFLADEVRRAPRWMHRLGLEWLHRLWQEPRRLARRYVVEGVPFAVRLLAHALRVRWSRRRQRR